MLAKEVLAKTILDAAYMFTHTNGKLTRERLTMYKTSQQAFAFLQGTGLEVMIQEYGLAYDAENIRSLFYEKFHVKG